MKTPVFRAAAGILVVMAAGVWSTPARALVAEAGNGLVLWEDSGTAGSAAGPTNAFHFPPESRRGVGGGDDGWRASGGDRTGHDGMPPCEAPAPTGLQAAAGKRKVTLSWTAVTGAASYKVYYSQSGKYTLRGTSTTAEYTDSGLVAGQNYCYAVTAMVPCNGATVESVHSTIVCATATR